MTRLLILAVILFAFSASATWSQQPPSPPNRPGDPAAQCPTHAVAAACPADEVIQMMSPHPEWPGEQTLLFTPDQQPKAEAIRDNYHKKLAEANSQVQSADWALVNALASQKMDPAKLQELMTAAAKADEEAMKVRVNYWVELKKLLAPDQDKQVSLWLQKRLMPTLNTNPGGAGGGFGRSGYGGGY